jgi:hypothetical protein
VKFLALVLLVVALAIACVTVEKTIVLTPETAPGEVRDAGWEQKPLHYCLVPEPGGFVSFQELSTRTAAAFAAWGIEARNDGECEAIKDNDGVNQIGWGDLPQEQHGVHEAGNTMLRYRTCRMLCPEGTGTRIVEADIIIARRPPAALSTPQCLYTTLLHETGHFFGIQHLESPAIMAPALRGCPQQLTDIDRRALEALYAGS